MAHKNKVQFIMIFTVSPEHVAEGDRIFQSHAKWMASTHHRNGEKALLVYDVSKTDEMMDPMDPNSGTTGNTQYVVAEVYESPAGLADHWKQAGESWEDFDSLKNWMGKGQSQMINGAGIVHSLW